MTKTELGAPVRVSWNWWLVGWMAMVGGSDNTNVATALVTAPQEFVTTTS